MKCAARFEKLLHERRASETTRDMNDKELLEDIVAKYNGYKATAALKRWQIGPEGERLASGDLWYVSRS